MYKIFVLLCALSVFAASRSNAEDCFQFPPGTDPKFIERVKCALEELAKTPTGKKLIDDVKLYDCPTIIAPQQDDPSTGIEVPCSQPSNNGVPSKIMLDPTDPSGVGPFNRKTYPDQLPDAPPDTSNPKDCGLDPNDPKKTCKELAVNIAHELGHTAERKGDETQGGHNVRDIENKVRKELGICPRKKIGAVDVN